VVRIASAQRGFVHHDQLAAAGLTRHVIAHRRATAWLAAYLPRVYLVGRQTLEPLGAETAAVLFYRGHAVLSHATATALWGITEPDAAVRLVVETDASQFHSHPRAFENDRRRDQILVAHRYRVIGVTWRQLREEPLAVVARITMALMNQAS
jgi:hypothetical protein